MLRWSTIRKRLIRGLALLVLAWVLLTLSIVLLMRFMPPTASAFMVGHRLSTLGTDHSAPVQYQWVPWDQMNKQLPLAMVAAEDQRFPLHRGFDLEAIRKVWQQRRSSGTMRGASTISQQVAKNLFLWNGRSWLRKGLEAYFTLLIEAFWPKQRILEVYANIAELGNGIYGVGAASRIFFDIDAAQLTAYQASLLAAVLPNPKLRQVNAPSAAVLKRASWIRRQMRNLGGISYLQFSKS